MSTVGRLENVQSTFLIMKGCQRSPTRVATYAPSTPNIHTKAVISDRHFGPRTVQLRIAPHAKFIEVPLAELAHIVLDAWDQRMRRVPDRLPAASLASNPNVVTVRHLHRLLHSFGRFPPIRSTFAKLARLVNLTPDWPDNATPKLKYDTETEYNSTDQKNDTNDRDEEDKEEEGLPPLPKQVLDQCFDAAWKVITRKSTVRAEPSRLDPVVDVGETTNSNLDKNNMSSSASKSNCNKIPAKRDM